MSGGSYAAITDKIVCTIIGRLRELKVIRRLMAEEGLAVIITRCRKYSSYAGEITPSIPNLLARDFIAEAPNQKWVTDITEFSIQVEKIYLSPIIDCFDNQITN